MLHANNWLRLVINISLLLSLQPRRVLYTCSPCWPNRWCSSLPYWRRPLKHRVGTVQIEIVICLLNFQFMYCKFGSTIICLECFCLMCTLFKCFSGSLLKLRVHVSNSLAMLAFKQVFMYMIKTSYFIQHHLCAQQLQFLNSIFCCTTFNTI